MVNDSITEAQARQDIFTIVARHSKREVTTLDPSMTLVDLGMTSLTAIETLFDIEEHFDIDLPAEDINFETGNLQQLLDIVAQVRGVPARPVGGTA